MSNSNHHPRDANFILLTDGDRSDNRKTCICRACCWFWFILIWIIALFLVLVSCAAMHTLRITRNNFNAKVSSVLLTDNQNITILHRGYINEYQENTLGAIKDAYARGFAAEFDISHTADDKYVLYHDYKDVENVNYADIENHTKFDHGWKFPHSPKVPLLSEALNAICADTNSLSKAPFVVLDMKVHKIPLFVTNNIAKHNDNILKLIEQSQCANLSAIFFYFSSFNGPALQDLVEKWSQHDIKGTIQTEIYLTHLVPPGIIFWLKSRIWAFGIKDGYGPSCIGLPRNAYKHNTHMMDKYQELGFCGWYYQPGDYFEEDEYDEDLRLGQQVENINRNVTIVNAMIQYQYDHDKDGKPYDHTASMVSYVLFVIGIVVSWLFIIASICCGLRRACYMRKYNESYNRI